MNDDEPPPLIDMDDISNDAIHPSGPCTRLFKTLLVNGPIDQDEAALLLHTMSLMMQKKPWQIF